MGVAVLAFEIIAVLIFTSLLLHRYGNWRKQGVLVSFFALIGWSFAFLTVVVLPTDIAEAIYKQCLVDNGKSNISSDAKTGENSTPDCGGGIGFLPENTLKNFWRVVYYSSQILTWFCLPMLQSYSGAGEFTVFGKFRTALKENLIFYSSYLLLAGILLVYLAAKGLSLSPPNLVVVAVTASNTWGLFLLVLLLGYGMVEVPRQIWLDGGRGYALQKLYWRLEQAACERQDAEEALRDVLDECISMLKSLNSSHPLYAKAQLVIEEFPEAVRSRRVGTPTPETLSRFRDSEAANLPSEANLVRLRKRAIQVCGRFHRSEAEWLHLIEEGMQAEDREKSESVPLAVQGPARYLEWYYVTAHRPAQRVFGILLGLMSILLVWSETTMFSRSPTLSLAAIFVEAAAGNHDYSYIQLSSLICVIYLSVCAYYTVFRLKIYRYYNLSPHHMTDAYSLLFCGGLLTRMTAPLCLNFLGLVHLDTHIVGTTVQVETSFTQVMGHLDVIPIVSRGFNVYFPCLLLVLCLTTWFRLGQRCLHAFGVEQFFTHDLDTQDTIQAGRRRLQVERNRIQRERTRVERDEYWKDRFAAGNDQPSSGSGLRPELREDSRMLVDDEERPPKSSYVVAAAAAAPTAQHQSSASSKPSQRPKATQNFFDDL